MISRPRTTYYMGQALSSPAKPAQPFDYPVRMKCRTLIKKVTIAVKNNDAAPHTVERQDLESFLGCIFNKQSLSFGKKSPQPCDVNIAFGTMRNFEQEVSGRDYFADGPSGWVELSSLGATDAVSASIAGGAAGSVVCYVKRSFDLPRLEAEARDSRCPGSEQMSQVYIEDTPGGSFSTVNAYWLINGNVQIDVLTDDIPTDDDSPDWVQPVQIYRTDIPDREQHGPRNCTLLEVVEETYAGPSSTVQKFDLEVDGRSIVKDVYTADQVAIEVLYEPYGLPSGDAPNGNKTVFYKHIYGAKLTDLPTGETMEFVQPGNEIATPKMRWYILPGQDKTFLQRVAENVSGGDDKPEARLVNADAYHGRNTGLAHSATAGVVVMRPAAEKYTALPSIPAIRGSLGQAIIPTRVQDAAKAGINASENAAKPAAAMAAAQGVARFVPGWLNPSHTGAKARAAGTAVAHGWLADFAHFLR